MSNMSYCRFQNTEADFRDCVRNLRTLNPEDHSYNTEQERDARARLIEMAVDLLQELGLDPDPNGELDELVNALNSEPVWGDDE